MSSALSLQSTVKLNDGVEVPILALGVYEMTDEQTIQAVTWALEAGVRHVDTAACYGTEGACKKAIEEFLTKSGLARSTVFYSTKLRESISQEDAAAAIQSSLRYAPGGIIDLCLMHDTVDGPVLREEIWGLMEKAKEDGLVRSIGVSNWGVDLVEEHMQCVKDCSDEFCTIMPSVNQIDLHPFMTRKSVVEVCEFYGIRLEACAPLVRGLRFDHPVVQKIAKRHGVTAAQSLIRWSLQKGFICVPKSATKARIESNADVFGFELTKDEMVEMNGLDEHLVTGRDVFDFPVMEETGAIEFSE